MTEEQEPQGMPIGKFLEMRAEAISKLTPYELRLRELLDRALPCITHATACGIWFDSVGKCNCGKPQLVQEIHAALRQEPKP